MNTPRVPAILLFSVLTALASCSSPRPPPTEAAAPASPLLSPEDADMPTQEQADKDAAATINEADADEELHQLEQELGAEGG